MSSEEENIKIIQEWYRTIVKFKLKIYNQINSDINNIYYLISSCMRRIHNSFILDILSQNKYNTYMIN